MKMSHPRLVVPERPDGETLCVPVLKVYDGDGFLTEFFNPRSGARIEVAIRFGFIDAPETDQPGGPQARDFLISLIGSERVDIAPLIKMDTGRVTDRHHRIVCVPYLTSTIGDEPLVLWPDQRSLVQGQNRLTRNIELEMILNGWAWVLERYGPDERYLDALADARRYRRGIWAFDDNISPWEFKRRKYQKRASIPSPSPQRDLFRDLHNSEPCPAQACDGHLVNKNGRFGAFQGCSNFPLCRYSRGLER